MPKNKDFYHRIEIIDECLRRRNKKWSVDELTDCVSAKLFDHFGKTASKRTIQYDLDYLINEKQAPVEKIREGGKVYYRYFDANYSLKNLPLTHEEVVLLKDAVAVLRQVGGLSLVEEVNNIVNRLENSLTANFLQDHSYIQFEKHTISCGTSYLDDLFTAIKEKTVLRIAYQPFEKELREWIIHPYLLKEYRNRWFLIGRNSESNQLTNLALDRIKKVRNSSEEYRENNLFDPEAYYNNVIGVTLPQEGQISDIVIRVKKGQVPYVMTKPIHFTQEIIQVLNDGSMEVKLRLIPNYELRSVLFSFGSGLEVLEPMALREQMKQVFAEGSSFYQ